MAFVDQYKSGRFCSGAPWRGIAVGLFVSAGVVASGCAVKPPESRTQLRVAGPVPHLGQHAIRSGQEPRLRIEDDGLAEQSPPRIAPGRGLSDDPAEPFSPNYGSVRIIGEEPSPADLADDGLGLSEDAPVVDDLPDAPPHDFRTALIHGRR